MTDLTPVAGFDPVPQLERETLALAGAGGPMNAQAQALLNRTEALKNFQDKLSDPVADDGSLGSLPYDDGRDYPAGSAGAALKEARQESGAVLRDDLEDSADPANGSGIPAFNPELEYPEGSAGSELLEVGRKNYAWAGFFDCWVMGFSRAVLGTERVQIPAGVTHGRAGFVTGTTVYQSGPGRMRVQRNAGNTDTANHTVAINLTAAETAPLRGKTCTAHIFARAGADYSGAGITLRVQSSVEVEQPILSSVAQYTNGQNLLASITFSPDPSFPIIPIAITFDVPEDATQVALCLVIPFSGTAGANDSVEFSEAPIYIANGVRRVFKPTRGELDALGATRYQTSYPYGVTFGAGTNQGGITAISQATSATWAMAADVRFSPRMVIPPRFQFVGPGSGTRSRWLNVDAGTFINGLAYDLSDSGVTVTNNAAPTANTRYLFQWAADCLF